MRFISFDAFYISAVVCARADLRERSVKLAPLCILHAPASETHETFLESRFCGDSCGRGIGGGEGGKNTLIYFAGIMCGKNTSGIIAF